MKLTPLLVILVTLFAANLASAADPVRLEVNALEEKPGLVSMVITALDGSGKPLTDLTANNFKASLNGAEVPIASLDAPGAGTRLTTGIVLLVDVSGSMYGEPIVAARAALDEFVKNLDPADQVAVLAFSTTVSVLQDFTANRSQISAGINKLTAFGDTALYDAVIAATQKASELQANRRMVVLLSDGVSTINNGARDSSLETARSSGVNFVSVGLGNAIDREYLQALSDVTGGRWLEASTPAALRQAYIDLAASIRSRYTVHITIPPTVDRTVDGKLTLRFSSRAGEVTIERQLPPLPGAKPPAFDLTLAGIRPNQDMPSQTVIAPQVPAGVSLARVEYFVDGVSAHVATAPPFDFTLDPAALQIGAHVVRAVATDPRGATAETEVAFRVPAPAQSSPIVKFLPVLALLVLLAGCGYLVFRVVNRRLQRAEEETADNVVRIRPFAVKSNEEMAAPVDWPERPPAPVQPVNQVRGRIVVMDEAAIREGDLTKITEYSIGTAPLTLGAGPQCDIQLTDVENMAMEEARLWVQKGRLIYHKLTTLSAMATEGVTSGWLLLADGEEFHLGKYRLLFQAEVPASNETVQESLLPPEPNKQFTGWSV